MWRAISVCFRILILSLGFILIAGRPVFAETFHFISDLPPFANTVTYKGETRPIAGEKLAFLEMARDVYPDSRALLDLYDEEILIEFEGEEIWLPVQSQVLAALRKEVLPETPIIVLGRLMGSLTDGTPVLVLIDFESLYVIVKAPAASRPLATALRTKTEFALSGVVGPMT